MAMVIPLTQGKMAIVDEDDYEKLSKFMWHAYQNQDGIWRAASRMGGRHIHMHSVVMDTPPGFEIDHKDRDGLNNQKSNLRVCTRTQNNANHIKRVGGTSRFKGVSWATRERKWRAVISAANKQYELGTYHDEVEAAKAYNTAATLYFGEFARHNELPVN